MNRRGFLRGLAASAGLLAVPPPVRRYWAVPANAPVGTLQDAYDNGQAVNIHQFDGPAALMRDDYGRPDDMYLPKAAYEEVRGVLHVVSPIPVALAKSLEAHVKETLYPTNWKKFRFTG